MEKKNKEKEEEKEDICNTTNKNRTWKSGLM